MRQIFREVLVSAVLGLSVNAAYGQNATWLLSPGSSDFNTGANWSPATVPMGTAIFGASNTTSLTFSIDDTIIGSMQFNAGAPAYSFAVSSAATLLEFNGAGIVNNSANAPTINNLGGGGTPFLKTQAQPVTPSSLRMGPAVLSSLLTPARPATLPLPITPAWVLSSLTPVRPAMLAIANNGSGSFNRVQQHQHSRQRYHHQQQRRCYFLRRYQHVPAPLRIITNSAAAFWNLALAAPQATPS